MGSNMIQPDPPEKILIESIHRAIQLIANAIKRYSQTKYPSKKLDDSQ
jgi:hypothetical protein